MKKQNRNYLFAIIFLEMGGITFSILFFPKWLVTNWWYFLLPFAVFVVVLGILANWRQIFGDNNPFQMKKIPHNNTFALPNMYYPRTEYMDEIKSLLLNKNSEGDIESFKVGLHGMGGIGKTVLAIAICHDNDIKKRFKDGIFWITIGNENIEQRVKNGLRYIIKILDSEEKFWSNEDFYNQEKSILQQVIKDKSCLIILDDVWQRESVYAFECLGNNSALLITTRDKTIIDNLYFFPIEVKIFSQETSKLVLANWVDSIPNKLPAEAEKIIDECGCLPLGIAIAGSYLKDHPDNWKYILNKLKNADLKKLESKIDHYENYESLYKVILVSIESLPMDKQKLIYSLSIFPEDTKIPLINIQKLWETYNVEKDEVEDLVEFFKNKSLLFYQQPNVSFHDTIRDFLRLSMEDQLPGLNQRFLKSYGIYRED